MHIWKICSVLLMALLLAGCAQTIVPLRYQNLSLSTPDCSSPVVIGEITDQRPKPLQIGTTLDGKPFYAESMVDAWVRQALVSQLRAQGCRVLPAEEADGSGVAVRGEVTKAWLRQISRTEYSGQMRIALELSRQGQTIHKEIFKAEIEKRVVPKRTVPQSIMAELLQDLMSEIVPRIIENNVTQEPG
jgi:uncharacterized lipoprotein YmbA